MKKTEENDRLRQMLRQAMPDDLPQAVEQRLQNRLAVFCQHANVKSPAPSFSSIRRLRSRRLVGWTTAAVAAAILLAAMLLTGHSAGSTAWAEMVKAVAKKPWLHAVTVSPDGKKGELWFSASRAVMAMRTDKRASWADLEQKTIEDYDPEKNTIVRAPDHDRREAPGLLETTFAAFLSSDTAQAINAGRYRLVHQQQSRAQENGRRWIEHRYRVHDEDYPCESESPPSEWIVYLDPDTQLPFRLDIILHHKEVDKEVDPSKKQLFRCEIDYPETGPANIYALGAPNTATVLDRLLDPSRADVRRLVAGVRAARWRSDKYYALLVDGEVDRHWSDCSPSYRVWRSGSRWKVEQSSGYDVRRRELPPKDADPATWWKQNLERVQFVPFDVCDGKWQWNFLDRNRMPAVLPGLANGEYLRISDGHPEYLARPLPDLDCPGNEARLNPKPAAGPPNTVLLEVRHSDQTSRYWIDPQRGYLVMRYEELVVSNGKENVLRGHAIEGVTQDPGGQWYPTAIRMFKRIVPMGTDKPRDGILRCYYDFTTPIPDSMFEDVTAERLRALEGK
jgi:hypothetical protein